MNNLIAKDDLKVSALTIDVEDGINIAMRDYFNIDIRPTDRVIQNMTIILDIFSRNNIKATFFILGEVIEVFPDLVRKIDSLGHEIGIHGYHHDQVFRLNPAKLASGLKKAKDLTENLIGRKVYGFRAPAFSIRKDTSWALDVIAECGFEYDSSIFPSASLRYGWNGFPKDICRVRLKGDNSIVEVPLSVINIGGRAFPVCGGGYLRYYPYSFTRSAFKTIGKHRPVIVYLHPYELDTEKYPDYFHSAVSKAGLRQRVPLMLYRLNKSTVRSKLDRLSHEFRFAPMFEIIANADKNGLIKEVELPENSRL